MIKKCILVVFIVLSLSSSEHFKIPYNKYYQVFPTDKQYKECFGEDYYCAYNETSDELYEKSFKEACIYGNSIGMSYYCLNDDIYSYDITLEIADQYNHLAKSTRAWLGDFNDEYLLESNDHYSLYCLSHDSNQITRSARGLYGNLYFDHFEIYFVVRNYNCSLESLKLRHLDELQEYFDKLYNLIDTNRIEASL